MSEKKMTQYDAPVYVLDVDLDDNETGYIRNSGVAMPAVGIERFAFEKEIEKYRFTANEKEQVITSISLLADTPLERYKNGEKYYTLFDQKSIQNIRNKRAKDGLNNEFTLYHDESKSVEGIYLVESYIVKNGRVKSELFDVPDGSLVDTYWIPNLEQYNELVADENFKGFSIEINAFIKEIYSEVEEKFFSDKVEDILTSKLTKQQKKEKIKKLISQ